MAIPVRDVPAPVHPSGGPLAAEGDGEIPDYAFDVHTALGRTRGATRKQFFRDEFEALQPRLPGLFDDAVE